MAVVWTMTILVGDRRGHVKAGGVIRDKIPGDEGNTYQNEDGVAVVEVAVAALVLVEEDGVVARLHPNQSGSTLCTPRTARKNIILKLETRKKQMHQLQKCCLTVVFGSFGVGTRTKPRHRHLLCKPPPPRQLTQRNRQAAAKRNPKRTATVFALVS